MTAREPVFTIRHSMGTIFWTLIIGLVIGAVAKLLMPGKDPGGCIITILLGIAGAFVAGYIGRVAGWYQPGQPAGFIASVIGAMILLLLYRMIAGRRT
ncbi:MAG TPA: GlsB/YeaQ/YmgE family stress response membrane protein [Chthoniobacterales bacterium]